MMTSQSALKALVLFTFLLVVPALGSSSKKPDDPIQVLPVGQKSEHLLWQYTTGLDSPESALFYRPPSKKGREKSPPFVLITNVSGSGHDADGKGWITKLVLTDELALSEKDTTEQWTSQMNAPKGIRIDAAGEYAWVADIKDFVRVNLRNGQENIRTTISTRSKQPAPEMLNDVAVDPKMSDIYVSDTWGSRVYRIRGRKFEAIAPEFDWQHPNGLLVDGEELIVASWGKIDPEKKTKWATTKPGGVFAVNLKTNKDRAIGEPIGNLDGLEKASDGSYLVSDFNQGKIFRLDPKSGERTTILTGANGAADFSYDAQTKTLFVVRMNDNAVDAYRIKY